MIGVRRNEQWGTRRNKKDSIPALPKPSNGHWVKDYSKGNICEIIYRTNSIEELTQLRDEILILDQNRGGFPARTRKRLEAAMNTHHTELLTRKIFAPPTGRVLVPTSLAQGKLIVGPDGK